MSAIIRWMHKFSVESNIREQLDWLKRSARTPFLRLPGGLDALAEISFLFSFRLYYRDLIESMCLIYVTVPFI